MGRVYLSMTVVMASLTLVFAPSGCGGGGGAGPGTDSFSGTYFQQLFGADPLPPIENLGQWGTAVADGAGSVTGGTVTSNVGGNLSGPGPVFPFTYTIASGGRITFNAGTALEGGIAPDGRVLSAGSITAGDDPVAAILLRRQGSFTNASLFGSYHVCAFHRDGGTDITWWGGVAAFDGVNAAVISVGSNTAGTITPPGIGLPWSYSVTPDGGVRLTNGLAFLPGGMLEGGELVVLSGTDAAVDAQALIVMIQRGAGLTPSTFSGTYHTVGLGSGNTPPPRYTSVTGTSFADGTGLWTPGAGTINDGTSSQPLPPGVATPYNVTANGSLSVSGGLMQGGVSPSGNFAVMAGATTTNSNPIFWFLHR